MIGDVEAVRRGRAEDGFDRLATDARGVQAQGPSDIGALGDSAGTPPDVDYLKIVKDCEQRGNKYILENLRHPWDAAYRAFRNQHFAGSKYYHTDYRNRSKLFRPKTRTAVRKADAAAVASLFATSDAVKCSAGNEGDKRQQAAAALLQEVLAYRTDRTSGIAAIPWFRVCAGAHQTAMIQSACVSKQSWKLELRSTGTTKETDPDSGEETEVETFEPYIDRPDSTLLPLENIIIDPAASWLDPIQSAAYFIAKYPMTIDEVRQKSQDPRAPWKKLDEAQLRAMTGSSVLDARATRQSREGGTDRLDTRFTGTRDFEIIWAYEVFIRYRGQNICFWSAQDRHYFTDPKPVAEVYPEQGGERPYTFGVINLEAHRLFPMSPVESWQQTQIELNDFANLTLDQAKLSVSPVTKVVRGHNVDLDALMRRGPSSQILVETPEDVTWDKPPGVDGTVFQVQTQLSVDFDDQAGQFNSGSVQTNRSLNETVGGLQLISGAADATQEFDLRVWIETWVEPTIAQLVKLIQYYESDEVILGLCGDRAALFEKFGISEINDHLLQEQVKVKVDAGVGNADPAQRMQKLGNALGLLMPMMKGLPQFGPDGDFEVNVDGLTNEVFSLAGYRDGNEKFITKKPPKPQQGPPPQMQLALAKLQSEIDKNKATAKASQMTALAAVAKVQLGDKQLEADNTNALLDRHLAATDMGHRHGSSIAERAQAAQQPQPDAGGQGGAPPSPDAPPTDQGSQGGGQDMVAQLVAMLSQPRQRQFKVSRDPHTNRIDGVTELSGGQPMPPNQFPPGG